MTREEASAIPEPSPHADPAESLAQSDTRRRQLEDAFARPGPKDAVPVRFKLS